MQPAIRATYFAAARHSVGDSSGPPREEVGEEDEAWSRSNCRRVTQGNKSWKFSRGRDEIAGGSGPIVSFYTSLGQTLATDRPRPADG